MANSPVDIRKDMLTTASSVQEVLRALYLYGVDYIMMLQGKSERLLHKEQLVALLEHGRDKATLEDISGMILGEPLSAKMKMEDIDPLTDLLLFTVREDESQQGELDRMTFEAYREKKIADSRVIFPDWWDIPLPLVHIEDDRIFLNQQGEKAIPGGAASLVNQIDRMRLERIVSIRERKEDKTFSLYPLTGDTFLAEDISGDYEMAEDLVWWAAIGKAFVDRMKKNGLRVRRFSPYETPPTGAAEIISCSWEGERIGCLAIEVPQAADTENTEETSIDSPVLVPPAKPTPKPRKDKKRLVKQEGNAPEPELKEPEEQSVSMKKTAAKNAYGLKSKPPAAESDKKDKIDKKNKVGKNGNAAGKSRKKQSDSG